MTVAGLHRASPSTSLDKENMKLKKTFFAKKKVHLLIE
ncbi:hypothetical protein EMIT07CA2_10564 [Brevibacillus sp. IT-7CA2]